MDFGEVLRLIMMFGSTNGGTEVESLSVTENGEYTAPEGTAYSPVMVNVPPTPITQVGSTLYIGTEETNDG